MKVKKKRLLGVLLSLVLTLGLMSDMSLTAYAIEGDPYTGYVNNASGVVKFNNSEWYIIKDECTNTDGTEGTVTLFAKDMLGASAFKENAGETGYEYNGSTIKGYLDGMINGSFSSVADAIVSVDLTDVNVTGAKLWLLSNDEAGSLPAEMRKCSTENFAVEYWWLRTKGWCENHPDASWVSCSTGEVIWYGDNVTYTEGVRPALKLDLSKVTFDSETKTFSIIPPAPPATVYKLWVGDIQVTSNNTSGTGWNYDAATNTLTLSGANITSGHQEGYNPNKFGIYYYETSDDSDFTFTITLAQGTENNIVSEDISRGIYSDSASIVINGGGKLNISASDRGIDMEGQTSKKIAIDANEVKVTGNHCGIFSQGAVYINSPKVIATGPDSGYGIRAGNVLYISENTTLTCIGDDEAMSGTLKNSIEGAGWTDTEGTMGRGVIPVSGNGQDLDEYDYKKIQFPESIHEHEFTYSADGNTITATCVAEDKESGCSLKDSEYKTTVTITAPTLTTYGQTGEGISPEAKVTDETGIITNEVVKYYKATKAGDIYTKTGTALTTAPTDAGDYAAEITLGTEESNQATASVGYTISKAEPAIEAPTGTTAGFGQTLADITLTNPAGNISGTWSWEAPGTTSVGEVGNKTFKAKFTPSDTVNYKTKENVDVSVTVVAIPVDRLSFDKNSIILNTGDKSKPDVKVEPENASFSTFEWSSSDKNVATVDTFGNVSAKVPGTTTIIAKTANGTPDTSDDKSATCTVIVIKPPVAKTIVFNSKPQELIIAGETSGSTLYYALGESGVTAPEADDEETPADQKKWSTSIPEGTDIKTYYVWYKVKGDDDHTDSTPVCITVTISAQSSDGGSYTPPTPPTPPAPPAEKYTVPVENESTVQVETTISGGTAKVGDITTEDIEKVTAKDGDSPDTTQNTTIEIDVSGAQQKVDSVQLTKDTVDRLAETAADNGNGVDTVTIRLTNARVELDAATLQAVSEEAEGNDIRLVVDDTYKKSSLNTAQRKAIQSYEDAATFEAYFESNGSRIHDFKGGTARVSVKYDLPLGKLARFVHMLYLNPTGAVERFVTTCADGWVTGRLNHFSEYAIVYDTAESNATGEAEDKEKETDPEPDPEPDPVETVIMYRIYNPNSGEHFYTANEEERDNVVEAGWNYEGIGWIAPIISDTPVYRLYNANVGDHLYTTSIRERDNLIKAGWRDEGIGWYSDDEKTVPLYRQYNPNAITGTHNYTAYKEENDWLVGLGWRAEDIGWYGVAKKPVEQV